MKYKEMDYMDYMDYKLAWIFLGWATVVILLSPGGELSSIAKQFWLACSVSGMIYFVYFGTDKNTASTVMGALGSAIFGPVMWLTFLTSFLFEYRKRRKERTKVEGGT